MPRTDSQHDKQGCSGIAWSFICTFRAAPTLQVQGHVRVVGPSPGYSRPKAIIPVTRPEPCATCGPSSWTTVPVSWDGFTSGRDLVPSTHGKKPAYNLSKSGPEPKRVRKTLAWAENLRERQKPTLIVRTCAEVFFNGFKGSFA